MATINEPKTIRIFLVRHGESEANAQAEIRTQKSEPKIDLTPRGWAQALADGIFFRKFFDKNPPDGKVALWHGPLNRQRETAQGIREAIADRIAIYHEDDDLAEQGFGVASGRKGDGWHAQFPEFAACQDLFRRDRAEYFFAFPGGESRADVGRRCREVKSEIIRASEAGVTDFIIVTSSVPLRGLVKELLGLRYEDLQQEPSPHNCDVRLIEGTVDKGYIFHDGVAQKPTIVLHPSDRDHFSAGDYFPPFVRGAIPAAGPQLSLA